VVATERPAEVLESESPTTVLRLTRADLVELEGEVMEGEVAIAAAAAAASGVMH
jgi:hypothetical protein